jgi:uncharacterized protein YjbI with pentapeptide repeats
MTNNELLSLLKEDVNRWNELRQNNEIKATNLLTGDQTNVTLRDLIWSEQFQTLINVDFSGADLEKANLKGAMLGIFRNLLILLEKKGLSSEDLLELKQGMMILQKANMKEADLSGANLSGADLRAVDFRNANLSSADLSDTNLNEAELINVNLNDADLSGASLRNTKLIGLPEWIMFNPKEKVGAYKLQVQRTKLVNVDFTEARLNGLDFRKTDLSGIKNFSRAKLVKADLSDAILTDANLREADLRGANLTGAKLKGAKFNKISYDQAYPDKELGSLAKYAEEAHNAADLRGADFTKADLSGADLSGLDLSNSSFEEANLTGANLTFTDLTKKNFQKAILSEADLSSSILVQTDLRNATLTGCRVHGIAAWDVLLDGAIQSNLLITRKGDANITVQSLQMAQFIYTLLNRKNFPDFLDTITSKAVLILGRFSPERKIFLDAMADELPKHNLLPIIFDFDGIKSRDFTETIKILVGISLFVIADITKPKSSPLELQATVPDYQIPFVPIIQVGEAEFSMFSNLASKYDWVLDPIISYSSVENLLKGFKRTIIDRAWEKHKELQKKKTSAVETLSIDDYLKN